MKISLLFPALLLASAAQAQTNALKVDIFQPIVSTLSLAFEHKLSESSSVQIGVAGTFNYSEGVSNFGFSATDNPKTSGFSITPEYRYYLSERREALEGFYAAPFVRYQYLSQTGAYANNAGYAQTYNASLNSFGLGLIVGRHWIFKQRFSLDIYAGPGYSFTGVSSDKKDYSPSKSDFVGYAFDSNYDLRGGITFGLAF
jgi:hypothetical protein